MNSIRTKAKCIQVHAARMFESDRERDRERERKKRDGRISTNGYNFVLFCFALLMSSAIFRVAK